jgi:hypothetical protein
VLLRRYTRAELVTFLKAVDANLTSPADLLIIGGAAATLRYGATSATRDIDTWNDISPLVTRAAQKARAATGLPVPMERATVADAPYHYEDRTLRVALRLERLRVSVPERHDLVLMKTVRADRHDIDVILEMHRRRPLGLEILVDRFENEMGHVIKDERQMRLQFRLLIEELFGAEAARNVRVKRLPSNDPRV